MLPSQLKARKTYSSTEAQSVEESQRIWPFAPQFPHTLSSSATSKRSSKKQQQQSSRSSTDIVQGSSLVLGVVVHVLSQATGDDDDDDGFDAAKGSSSSRSVSGDQGDSEQGRRQERWRRCSCGCGAAETSAALSPDAVLKILCGPAMRASADRRPTPASRKGAADGPVRERVRSEELDAVFDCLS